MKKTYKNPTMVVVKIQTRQQMMTMSYGGTTTATNGNLGRDFDFDDDEE